MITLLLIIPFIGSLIILLISESRPFPSLKNIFTVFDSNLNNEARSSHTGREGEKQINPISPSIRSVQSLTLGEKLNIQTKMKQIALTTSLINFFLSLYLWLQFDSNFNDFQFVSEIYQ